MQEGHSTKLKPVALLWLDILAEDFTPKELQVSSWVLLLGLLSEMQFEHRPILMTVCRQVVG